MAAKQIIDEIKDYLEVVEMKTDRLKKNIDKIKITVGKRASCC